MSLSIIIQEKDEIFISGDSRESIYFNGEIYATGTHTTKVHQIGDRVIFTTGNTNVAKSVMEEYSRSDDKTIEHLKSIMDRHSSRYEMQHGARNRVNGGGNVVLGLAVCGFEEGQSVFYSLVSDKPEITKYRGESLRAADGTQTEEALALLKKCNGMNLDEALQFVYSSLSDERIGGELTIYRINKSGISSLRRMINDSRTIRIAPIEYMWTREHGLVVEREDHRSRAIFNGDTFRMQVGDGSGSYTDAIYFDPSSGKYKFNGTIEAADGVFSGALSAVTGTFKGALQAASGTFAGDLSAAGGTFRGNLQAAGGTFSGTISASTIIGGQINGTTIEGGTITGSTIQTSTSYPRSEMSVSGAMLAVHGNPGNSMQMLPTYGSGAPGLVTYESGTMKGALAYDVGTNLYGIFSEVGAAIRANGDIRIRANGGVALFDDFSKIAAGAPGSYQTLNSKLLGNVVVNPASKLLKFYSMTGVELFSVDLSSLA